MSHKTAYKQPEIKDEHVLLPHRAPTAQRSSLVSAPLPDVVRCVAYSFGQLFIFILLSYSADPLVFHTDIKNNKVGTRISGTGGM